MTASQDCIGNCSDYLIEVYIHFTHSYLSKILCCHLAFFNQAQVVNASNNFFFYFFVTNCYSFWCFCAVTNNVFGFWHILYNKNHHVRMLVEPPPQWPDFIVFLLWTPVKSFDACALEWEKEKLFIRWGCKVTFNLPYVPFVFCTLWPHDSQLSTSEYWTAGFIQL